jgi:DNA-binding Lrp family transcriptional regulator
VGSRREIAKERMLRLLSTDARASMNIIASKMGIARRSAYSLFNEIAEERGLKFVPEVDIEHLWKWEFIKKARLRTKRGILAEAMEELPVAGFGEYMVFVKFVGASPGDDELTKAVGASPLPQFAARLRGANDLMIYAVARNYEEALEFAGDLGKRLGRRRATAHVSRVWGSFGFFPLSERLISQFDIFDSYKNLLIGLNESGRMTFSEVGRKSNQGPAQMLYAYDRLVRTGILRRITYFEEKPNRASSVLFTVRVTDTKAFEASRDAWFMKLISEYEKRENECVFICNTPCPIGMLIVARFESDARMARFRGMMRSTLKGVDVSHSKVGKVLLGHLGIRDFDMRYTGQYKSLAMRRLVPRLNEAKIVVADNPDAL